MPRKLGNMTIQVLSAIARGVRYGFTIMDETGLPSGTVYPALSRLEDMGYVTALWQDPEEARRRRRPPRRYYAVTEAGRAALREAAARIRALDRALAAEARPLNGARG